jgi:hypothetical protein
MSQKEIVIPLAELTNAEIVCECGASSTFNKAIVHNPERLAWKSQCPGCGRPLSDVVLNWLGVWRTFVASADKDKVRFHVSQP